MEFQRKVPKRGFHFAYGMCESYYLVKRHGETIWRRIYRDWSRLNKNGSEDPKRWEPVPLVIKVKGVKVDIDRALCPSDIDYGE